MANGGSDGSAGAMATVTVMQAGALATASETGERRIRSDRMASPLPSFYKP